MGKSFRLPNSFGSVYKLSGNRRRPYAVAKTFGWDDNGKQIKKIIGYATTKKEGLEILLEYNKDPLTNVEQLELTFDMAFQKWLNLVETEQSISKSNIASYKSVYKNYYASLKNIKIVDMKTSVIQQCIDKCEKGFNTKRYIKMIASQAFKYCRDQLDMPLRKDFSKGLKIGENIKSSMHRPFAFDEIQKAWENIDIEFVDSILITLYTGMRAGELLKIELCNVFLEERYMIGGIKTKAGKNRIIPIHEKIVPIVENLITKNKHYLIEKDGKKVNYRYFADKYKSIMEQLQMDHKPHDGRHTVATELDNQGANELCVKIILGHHVSDITKGTYTHKKINQLIATINLISY